MLFKITIIRLFLSLFTFLLFCSGSSIYSNTESNLVKINENNYGKDLGLYLQIYEDKSAKLKFENILTEKLSSFKKSENAVPSFGFSQSNFWVRVHFINNQQTNVNLLLEVAYPLIDKVDFFIKEAGSSYTKITIDEDTPIYNRKIKDINPVININFKSGEEKIIYIRYADMGSVPFPLKIWSSEKYTKQISNKQLILGLYYGMMLIMIIYNGFLFFSIRDISYLYYVLYIISFLMFQLVWNGLAGQHLWPETGTWFRNNSIIFSLALFHIFMLQFSSNYLKAKINAPKLEKVILGLTGVWILQIMLTPLVGFVLGIKITSTFSIITVAVVILAGVLSHKKGYRPARYFLLAWTTFLSGGILIWLSLLKIIPSSFFIQYGFQIGSVMEVILLSLGLADRYNLLRKKYYETELKMYKEREILTREVHDTVGTELTKAIYSVADKPELLALKKQLEHVLEDTRDFTTILNMSNHPEQTFSQDIRNYFSSFDKLDKFNITLKLDNIPTGVSVPIRMHSFRILQEWFTNSIRHGNATDIDIHIAHIRKNSSNYMRLLVTTNGSSFSWSSNSRRENVGSGLRNIIARCGLIRARARSFTTHDGKNIFIMNSPVIKEEA
ncbi:MAG: 7TM diverse intracellular signaling domain-containing protein [Leptospirales bacterium]